MTRCSVRVARSLRPRISAHGCSRVNRHHLLRGRAKAEAPATAPAEGSETAPITDAQGRVQVSALEPGRYRIAVTAGAGTAATTADVPAGGTATAEVRLGHRAPRRGAGSA